MQDDYIDSYKASAIDSYKAETRCCPLSEESTPKTEGTAKAAHGLYK